MTTEPQTLSEALKTYDRAAHRDIAQSADAIRAEIVARFPLDEWPTMPLERYALGGQDKRESFCWYLEQGSPLLGSIRGGNSRNFGIYRRSPQKGGGWYFPPAFANVDVAWEALRGEFVRAFELARVDAWAEIDKLPLTGNKVILLKALHIYFPEKVAPVYSQQYLLHYLKQLGVTPTDPDPTGRTALNQRLRAILAAEPGFAGWTISEIGTFLYEWVPKPEQPDEQIAEPDGPVFGSPFNQLFGDEPEANWAFDLLSDTAKRLRITGPDDKRAAFSIRYQGIQTGLRLIFGGWLIIEIASRDNAIRTIRLNLPRAEYGGATATYAFKAVENETSFSIYDVPFSESETLSEPLKLAFNNGLNLLAKERAEFTTPFRKNAIPAIASAVFNPNERPALLKKGVFVPKDGEQYWKVSPGKGASQWEECLRDGFIGIGHDELGDLSGLSDEQIAARWDEIAPTQPEWTPGGVSTMTRFARIQEGDRIVANRGMKAVLGIGTVTGEYYYATEGEQRHRLKVTWDDTQERTVDKPGWVATVIPLKRKEFDEIVNAPVFPTGNVAPPVPADPNPHPVLQPVFTLDECAKLLSIQKYELEDWVAAIRRKKQAVFYGPPGTGKTFVAQYLAKHLVGGGDGFVDLVQFHPAYAYEDFIQGIRPQSRPSGGLEYPLVKGRFVEFCDKARKRQGPCVLILDEFNRANLARVFGELMFLLEYRDQKINLASGGTLKIPPNVYLIGTMNTADRSIALVDHALRRRFAFLALRPNPEILREYHRSHVTDFNPEPLIAMLKAVNQVINDANYSIGVTFFLRDGLREELPSIWKTEIEPYLEEYFINQPKTVDEFRWATIGQKVLP